MSPSQGPAWPGRPGVGLSALTPRGTERCPAQPVAPELALEVPLLPREDLPPGEGVRDGCWERRVQTVRPPELPSRRRADQHGPHRFAACGRLTLPVPSQWPDVQDPAQPVPTSRPLHEAEHRALVSPPLPSPSLPGPTQGPRPSPSREDPAHAPPGSVGGALSAPSDPGPSPPRSPQTPAEPVLLDRASRALPALSMLGCGPCSWGQRPGMGTWDGDLDSAGLGVRVRGTGTGSAVELTEARRATLRGDRGGGFRTRSQPRSVSEHPSLPAHPGATASHQRPGAGDPASQLESHQPCWREQRGAGGRGAGGRGAAGRVAHPPGVFAFST